MILVDTNVLLYAVNASTRQHDAAHRWLTTALGGADTLGLSWVVTLGFVRIATNRSILPRPLTISQAFDLIDSWSAHPAAVTLEPTARHRSILRGLLTEAGTAGNLTTDAHIAALAIENGAAVATFDRDFERFGVDIIVPG